ncbi:MAG: M61 family metallopeptidase [Gammaproteobacteria bacterium]
MNNAVQYTLSAPEPASHRFVVRIDIPQPDAAGQCLTLPAWIPGSYLVRDFARHVGKVRASSGEQVVNVSKTDKSSWRCEPVRGPLVVEYDVYAWDLSVRGAHLDATHGFCNGANVFLAVNGQENAPLLVQLNEPGNTQGWRVATTLPRDDVAPWGFGLYRAADYDELLDHPIEMGDFDVVDCEVVGVPHRVVLTGRHHCNSERLAMDVAKICAEQVGLFGELPAMPEYLFLTRVLGEGYGGLEHRSSTALMCSRKQLPGSEPTVSKSYRQFLGLVSHEYFHLWNVKRIKPAAFTPYELAAESYTELLWVFEGITSYYDDLALVRSGTISFADYLTLLGETISRVLSVPSHRWQTLAESSFDAWTKFYKPTPDSPNSIVSYYAKGALVALLLDLTLRERTVGKTSLDDVMRAMWQRYGATGRGVPEDGFENMAESVSGLDLGDFFERYIRTTAELDLERALSTVGVRLRDATGGPQAMIGLALKRGSTRIATIERDSPAEQAGLAPGDLLIALADLRVTQNSLSEILAPLVPGKPISAHVFRDDELLTLEITPKAAAARAFKVTPVEDATAAQTAARKSWLASNVAST